MPFKPGDPKPEGSGRQKGTPNKSSFNAKKVAEELGLKIDPLIFLLMVLNDDWKGLGFSSRFKTTKEGKKTIKTPHITFKMRTEAALELMPYLYSHAPDTDPESISDEGSPKVIKLAYNLETKPEGFPE